MRNIEWTNNSKVANFWSEILVFQIEKIYKFVNFLSWTIPGIFNLEYSKNFKFGKFQKFLISKILKKFKLENSKNFKLEQFQ